VGVQDRRALASQDPNDFPYGADVARADLAVKARYDDRVHVECSCQVAHVSLVGSFDALYEGRLVARLEQPGEGDRLERYASDAQAFDDADQRNRLARSTIHVMKPAAP